MSLNVSALTNRAHVVDSGLSPIVSQELDEVVALCSVVSRLALDQAATPAGIAALRTARVHLEAAALPMVRPLTSTRLDSEAFALLRGRLRATLLGGT